MSTRKQTIVDIVPGRLTTIILPFSEVCCHMGVAGQEMPVVLIDGQTPMVQLYQDGRPFSFPILLCEAGVRARPDGSYYATAITAEDEAAAQEDDDDEQTT